MLRSIFVSESGAVRFKRFVRFGPEVELFPSEYQRTRRIAGKWFSFRRRDDVRRRRDLKIREALCSTGSSCSSRG